MGECLIKKAAQFSQTIQKNIIQYNVFPSKILILRVWLYQKHAERFSHNAVEQIQRRISRHHEEVRQEEELSTAIIQQSIVLTAEESFIRVLTETEREVRKYTAIVINVTKIEIMHQHVYNFVNFCKSASLLLVGFHCKTIQMLQILPQFLRKATANSVILAWEKIWKKSHEILVGLLITIFLVVVVVSYAR